MFRHIGYRLNSTETPPDDGIRQPSRILRQTYYEWVAKPACFDSRTSERPSNYGLNISIFRRAQIPKLSLRASVSSLPLWESRGLSRGEGPSPALTGRLSRKRERVSFN